MIEPIQISSIKDREKWLALRRGGIGGSEVAAVLGLSPYRTPVDVWEDKTGRIERNSEAPSDPIYWGTMLEDLVAKEFERRTGKTVQRVNYILRDGADGWMIANIDRAIVNPEIARRVSVKEDKENPGNWRLTTDIGLECKTANQYMASSWGPSQLDEIIQGKVVSDHMIPEYYETQVQWYMAVTGLKAFVVAVLIGGSDFRAYWVKRDEDIIAALVSHCKNFWEHNVKGDTAPEPVNVEDVKKLYAKDNGLMKEADNNDATILGELRTVKENIKSLQEQEKALSAQLILSIGESLGLTLGGEKVATYKTQESNRFSTTDFKKSHPELYKEYTKTTSTRVLRVF